MKDVGLNAKHDLIKQMTWRIFGMETIYEDPNEQVVGPTSTWWSILWRRLQQSTLSVKDNCIILYILLGSVLLSFSTISDNLLDIFYHLAKTNEPTAAAYVLLEELWVTYRHGYWKTCNMRL